MTINESFSLLSFALQIESAFRHIWQVNVCSGSLEVVTASISTVRIVILSLGNFSDRRRLFERLKMPGVDIETGKCFDCSNMPSALPNMPCRRIFCDDCHHEKPNSCVIPV